MCLYPQLMYNPKYKTSKKNGGVIPAIPDKRVQWVPIGCGNCIECRKQKARGWQIRLLEDIKTNKNGKFITLTFSNESIKELIEQEPNKAWHGLKGKEGYERDNGIAKRAVRLFLERWRKTHKKSVRHWLITELGHNGTENIHMHGIIWTDEKIDEIRKHWKYGYIYPKKTTKEKNYVSERTVNYIIKYVTKQDEIYKGYKPIIMTSAGIGANYTKTYNATKNKYNEKTTNETYRTATGNKIAMPTYWRNKIYDDEEREKLWLQKIDKNIRYVCGEQVSIEKDDKDYWALVEWHRKRSKQLGYATKDEIWKRKKYEEQRRNMMTEKRMPPAG